MIMLVKSLLMKLVAKIESECNHEMQILDRNDWIVVVFELAMRVRSKEDVVG